MTGQVTKLVGLGDPSRGGKLAAATALGTDTLPVPDAGLLENFLGRIAYQSQVQIAKAAALVAGTNSIPIGSFTGAVVDVLGAKLVEVKLFRGATVVEATWSYNLTGDEVVITGAQEGDIPILVQYGMHPTYQLEQRLSNTTDLSQGAAVLARSAPVIPSLSNLRTVSGRYDNDTCFLLYRDVEGYGGGRFRWDAESASADNGGTIIAPTGVATGRWLRIYEQVIQPSWFGAIPDYNVATGTGTDAAAAINAALAIGPIVQLDRGRYKVGTSLRCAYKFSGIELRGVGGGKIGNQQMSSELYGETGNYAVIDMIGSQFVKVSDLSVLSGLSNPARCGVHVCRATDSQYAQFNCLERVTVHIASDPAAYAGRGSVGIHNIAAEIFTLRDVYSIADTACFIGRDNTTFNIQSIYGTQGGPTSTSTFYFEGTTMFQSTLPAGAPLWLYGAVFAFGNVYALGPDAATSYAIKLTGACRGVDMDVFFERTTRVAMVDNSMSDCILRFHGVFDENKFVSKNPATAFVRLTNNVFHFIPTVADAFTSPNYWVSVASGDELRDCTILAPQAGVTGFSQATSQSNCEYRAGTYHRIVRDVHESGASVYTDPALKLGAYRFWHDSFGMLRSKASAPANGVDGFPFGQKVGIPANATAAGAPGQWAASSTFFYVYTGDGTTHSWSRVAIATW